MDTNPNRDPALDEIDKQFHQATLRERFKILAAGLRAPRDSREYKLARVEAQRLAAPTIAVLLPLLLVAAVIAVAVKPKEKQPGGTIVFLPNPDKKVEPLIPDPPKKNEPKEKDNDLPKTLTTTTDDLPPIEVEPIPVEPVPGPVPTVDFPVRKPIVVDHLPGDNGDDGGHGGHDNPPVAAEDAVMRGLRWLKLSQNPDGSWNANKPAMTGLALLCFLAHNELPGRSAEFGDTVRRGVEFLLASYNENTRSFAGADGNEYAHLIAAYALCEAYGLIQNPNIRTIAASATRRIIEGQHPAGGWDYRLAQSERADTSYMGWAAQSLRAAQLANLFADDPEWSAKLDRACKLSNNGFLQNGAPGGGFGYTGPGRGGLTAVGVLCMQYHGAAGHRQVADSLKLMAAWKPGWVATAGDAARVGIGESVQYYFYYATQAMYLLGGKPWRDWNDAMVRTYERAQQIRKAAIAGPDGVPRDIGWWENPDNHSDRPVMDTCLAILQLEVYYRGDRNFTLGVNAMGNRANTPGLIDPNDVNIETGSL